MKLSVLLLLASQVLSSASLNRCENDTTPVLFLDLNLGERVPNITANRNQTLLIPLEIPGTLDNVDETNLKWQTFDLYPPNGAISIYNGYVGRTDYVCQFQCKAGFYNPDMGPKCHYPYGGKEYLGSPFELLLNVDNFELMQWKDGSYGSVPPNSVKTCSQELYVGKNKYGLGKVDVKNEAFFLPWEGKEYWYKTYQVLTFNKDVVKEHLSDVKYYTDDVKIIDYPPETMKTTTITNHACQSVTGTATLSKTSQVEHRWDTSFSMTAGITASITAGIPLIGSTSISVSAETTFQMTKGTTYVESITHTLSVEHNVPPNYSCKVSMVAYKYGADIPYTARISRTYSNGETTWTSMSGTYRGVDFGDVRAEVDPCKPVPDPTPCS